MKHIAQTVEGMEDISIKEIEELTGAKAEKLQEGRVIFDTTHQKAAELTLNARSLFKVYELIQEIRFTSFEDLLSKVETFELEEPFVVRCQREGDHRFQSLDAEREIGEIFYNKGHKVDLHNPKTIVMADIVNDKCFLGKDLSKDKDLSRRDYKLKAHPRSINACLAYGALRSSGWTKDKSLMDPNCKDGTIIIEAALWAGDPAKITATDSQAINVSSAEINAKLAGVHKKITFANFHNPGTADHIVTSTEIPEIALDKSEDLLTDRGTITIVTQRENIQHTAFKLIKKREAKVREARYFLHTFQRQNLSKTSL